MPEQQSGAPAFSISRFSSWKMEKMRKIAVFRGEEAIAGFGAVLEDGGSKCTFS